MNQNAPRGRKAATINDVADAAGVSPMTVSRVINGETNVRAATRALVEAAIARLNYAPNPAARSLAGAEPIRIGLLYGNPSSAYLSEFLVGGLDQARRSNVQLVVEQCDAHPHAVEAALHLARGGVHGILLPSPLCDSAQIMDALRGEGLPVVAVASGRPAPDAAAVSIDDRAAAYAMTEHLARLGHRRIGFIRGNPDQTASALRFQGYCDAVAAMGLAPDDALAVPGLFTYRSGWQAAEALLDLPDPPTAIFASNDDMAAATVAVAHRRGLDVPQHLTVCGFDDTALATTIWPELTTIHQPITDMSRAAVELLVQQIRARRTGRHEPPPHRTLDYTLIRRESDAPPRAGAGAGAGSGGAGRGGIAVP